MMDYNTNMKNINWYPGHMKKTRELIEENLKMVDLVIEVVDARIPVSSRNPIIDDLIKGKRRVIALNKSDLADSRASEQWIKHFKGKGYDALAMDCAKGSGVNQLFKLLTAIQEEKDKERMRKKPLRMMIVGVPNVGKSSLINRMTGRKSAKTGEQRSLRKLEHITVLENPQCCPFLWTLDEAGRAELAETCAERLAWASQNMARWDLLILDECLDTVEAGLLTVQAVYTLLQNRPKGLEVVLTGRAAPPALLELADYHTRMQLVRHPFERGIPARFGIEY